MWVLIIILIITLAILWSRLSTQSVSGGYNLKEPYFVNMETQTLDNQNYRKVDYTTPNMQMVLMNIPTGQDIGKEIHPDTTQFIRVESGTGTAIIDGKSYPLQDDSAIIIPPGAEHNIISDGGLKLYSIYSPPEHPDGTVQYEKPGF